ncbi:uncharacterized protein LOC129950788 [Eupeodes corollae]|uniref:uncharacterized protein LOC129950788 n=1 Tax=Eupeodes corollae TaxID=290404 RepID=UPI0024907E7F|nr:uncharacterized protein LOC129950788 [Eupeodes corollae]
MQSFCIPFDERIRRRQKKTFICLVQKFDPDIEMEGRKTLKLTNQNQFETLVELMGRNVELARGFLKGIQKTDVKKEWAAIAEQLNSKGPPVRDGDGWQKVWADMKHNVKKKMIHNAKELNSTGGGPNKLKILSPLEEQVSNLLHIGKVVNPSGNAIGISQSILLPNSLATATSVPSSSQTHTEDTSMEFLESIVLNMEEPLVGSEGEVLKRETQHQRPQNETLGRKRTRASAFKQDRAELLQKQTVVQDITLNGINESLGKIEKCTKEIERYFKKCYRLEEDKAKRDAKRLKIQEEKLLIYKRETERKEAQRKETNKIKMMDLEIRKKKIEIAEKKLSLK